MQILNGRRCEAALRATSLGENFRLSVSSICAKGINGDTELVSFFYFSSLSKYLGTYLDNRPAAGVQNRPELA